MRHSSLLQDLRSTEADRHQAVWVAVSNPPSKAEGDTPHTARPAALRLTRRSWINMPQNVETYVRTLSDSARCPTPRTGVGFERCRHGREPTVRSPDPGNGEGLRCNDRLQVGRRQCGHGRGEQRCSSRDMIPLLPGGEQ